MPEYPENNNNDWLNPDYTLFHTAHMPSFFSRILQFAGLRKPLWSVSQFKAQLEMFVSLREKVGYLGRFVQKITPSKGARFFMWGDVHGSFHSLIRQLAYLKKEGIIDESLIIIAKDCFFVINGNVIDQSAYNLETLSLILLLLYKNPTNMVYIRGEHEDRQTWHNYDLKNELMVRAKNFSSEKIPLNSLITRFFNTLPLALYLIGETVENHVSAVRISYYGRDSEELNEDTFEHFLTTPQEKHNVISSAFILDSSKQPTIRDEKSYRSIDIKAIIKGEDRSTTFTPTDGLANLIPDQGAQAWSLLSAPNNTYRRLYNFFNDAFAVLTVAESIDKWTISLYTQDVRELLGIKKIKSYYLTSGISIYAVSQETIDKINKTKPIMLGSSMDLSRAKILSERIRDGLYAYISMINKAGGINNRLINLNILDDMYMPSLARQNIQQFLQSGISIILSPSGSPTIEAFLDLVKEKKILVLFPPTGAPIFRQPDLVNMINFRPSYAAEAYALVEHAVKNLRVHNIVFFYQNDAFGLGALYGGRIAAKDFNVKEIFEVSYSRNDVSFARQIEQIKDKNPDAICFFATADASRQFIMQMTVQYLTGIRLLGLSDWGADIFKNFIKYKGVDYVITNVVPNPRTSDLEIVREFREKAKKEKLKLDPFTLEGYINAALTVKLLTMSNSDDSHPVLVTKAESIKHEKFKGLQLNFEPKTRELSNTFWIDTGEDEWVEHQVKDLDLTGFSASMEKLDEEARSVEKNYPAKKESPKKLNPLKETTEQNDTPLSSN